MTQMVQSPQVVSESREDRALANKYEVSADGVVTSPYGKTLKPFVPNKKIGHRAFKFIDVLDGEPRPYTVYVHRLVWRTYVGKIPEGAIIRHKDENGENNSLDNLYMVVTDGDKLVEYTPDQAKTIN